MTRRRLVVLVLGIGALALLSLHRLMPKEGSGAGSAESTGATFDYRGGTFGTTFSISARLPRPIPSAELQTAIDRVLSQVDRSMSTYREDSELSALNRLPQQEPMIVSAELMEVLALSRRIHQETRGAFDVTVGPLVRAWGFGAGAATKPPTSEELPQLMTSVGTQYLSLDEGERRVKKLRDGMFIDLSAVAKGYGVDRVAEELNARGIQHYLVEIGGEIRVRGTRAGQQLWRLGIERPDPGERRVYGTLLLRDAALATSGDYRNFRRTETGTFSHTLDPRSGKPVPRRTASVSVVRPTAAEADALATGLGVLDPEEAIALAEQHHWAILLLLHTADGFEPRTSSPWRALRWSGPTVP